MQKRFLYRWTEPKGDSWPHSSQFTWTQHDEEEKMMQLKSSVFHILRKRNNLNDTMWLTHDADCSAGRRDFFFFLFLPEFYGLSLGRVYSSKRLDQSGPNWNQYIICICAESLSPSSSGLKCQNWKGQCSAGRRLIKVSFFEHWNGGVHGALWLHVWNKLWKGNKTRTIDTETQEPF